MTDIGPEAFADSDLLEQIGLPDSLRTIEDRAFLSCTKLEEIDFPAGLADGQGGL